MILEQAEINPIEDGVSERNPHLDEYVDLLVRLHAAMRQGDEGEADRLRDLMDEPGIHLTQKEVQWVKGVSADLYMLQDDEILQRNPYSPEEYQRLFHIALRQDDADTLLALARMEQNSVPKDRVAYGRARAYAALGFPGLSIEFLRAAMRLGPENALPLYRMVMLIELREIADLKGVSTLADAIFDDPDSPPQALISAVGALYSFRRSFPPEQERLMLGKLRREIEDTFRKVPPENLDPELASLGLVVLGDILENLNRRSRAIEAYTDATRVSPTDDVPWTLLGTALLKVDVEKALACYRRAVDLRTPFPLPYLALAKDAIESGETEIAKDLLQQVLRLIEAVGGVPEAPITAAHVYEFLGLAEVKQKGVTNQALNYLREARRLSPNDERIRKNYATALREQQTHRVEQNDRLSEWFAQLAQEPSMRPDVMQRHLSRPAETLQMDFPAAA